jgi:hypothetical protein
MGNLISNSKYISLSGLKQLDLMSWLLNELKHSTTDVAVVVSAHL